MPAQSEDVVRYQRYAQVVEAARTRNQFTMTQIKEACALENPAFVTRVIHTLERDAVMRRVPACTTNLCLGINGLQQGDSSSQGGDGRSLSVEARPRDAHEDAREGNTHVVHEGLKGKGPKGKGPGGNGSADKDPLANNGVREDVVQWLVDPQGFSATQWLDQHVYGHRLRRLPATERPRERLLAQGPAALRTAELLAILIRTGRPGESALEAGEAIARRFADCLENLPRAGRGELRTISSAIGLTAFCQIAAGIELGRRIAKARTGAENTPLRPRLTSPEAAIAYCQNHFQQLVEEGAQEEFHVVTLDTKLRPLDSHRVSVGLLDQAMIHPREVFRPAIQDAAKAILLVHNHPSGDPEPSAADLSATRQLESAGQVLGIEVVDHLVVGREGVVSLRQRRKAG